jgi:hypothetical protein
MMISSWVFFKPISDWLHPADPGADALTDVNVILTLYMAALLGYTGDIQPECYA